MGSAGECDVAVGTHEICSVPLQASRIRFRAPGENVQRKVSSRAHRPGVGLGLTVDMNLPTDRGERSKIVVFPPSIVVLTHGRRTQMLRNDHSYEDNIALSFDLDPNAACIP